MKKFVPLVLLFALLTAACGGGTLSTAEYCDAVDEFDALDEPENKDDWEAFRDGAKELGDKAPSEIRDDAKTVADAAADLVDVVEDADYVLEDVDQDAVFEILDNEEAEAAGERLSDWGDENCGGSS